MRHALSIFGPGEFFVKQRFTLDGEKHAIRPLIHQPIKTGTDGRFILTARDCFYTVMAMDRSRRHGGLVFLPKGRESEPVEIRLCPLVRVRGSFEGPAAAQQPFWSHVYVHVPADLSRPLDSTRLVSCGSFEARFEVWLPPGRYVIQGYSQDAHYKDAGKLMPNLQVALKGDTREVELGRFRLFPHRTEISSRIAEAKAAGTWVEYSKHYGQKPPRWHVTDARGVKSTVQLTDFVGKWVLVDFWGFDCMPCLGTGLPKLMKFYEDHEAQRNRFEILAICVDPDGTLKSMTDVDRRLEPIVTHVWGGKHLPFPVLLDSSFQTWERFGLAGMGQTLLFDPEGRLVEGDETVLAEKLKERARPKTSSSP
jgi:AhpC/TSA family